ncbi:MAG TPA: hypothetical protein VL381_06465 [Rhodocyclaceae bacterium]|jgi:hypothetical protein|nr:hypothetical protein [Rhodocyclaceae bacterium]
MNLNRILLASALLCMGWNLDVHAQELRDPTRPAGSVGQSSDAEQASSGLQSIVRRAGAKPQALINGELIALGGKVGDARLVQINESSVVLLSSSGGRETLTLTPGIAKTQPTKLSHRSKPIAR